MTNKFEKLLDYLVNEEMDKANELFHEIVVEKSRSIYENLIAQEAAEDEEEDEEEVDETMDAMDEEESMYEIGGDHSDDFVDSVVDKDAMGDDDMDDGMPGDDMGMDMGDHDMGDHDMGDHDMEGDDMADVKHDVEEIKDKLDQIFAALSGKEEPVDSDDDMDAELDLGDDEDESNDDEEDDDEDNFDETFVREYRELVRGKGKDYTAGSPGESNVHAKSAINANPSDRPHSKANAKNIAQSGHGENPDGTKPKSHEGGLVGKSKGSFVGSGTLNVDGKQTKGYTEKAKAPSKESGANTKDVLP